MADTQNITETLLAMYSRNDWIIRLNFKRFLSLSGLSRLARNSRILDCGCAMGHLIMELKFLGFTRVHGLDASQEMVEAARAITGAEIILLDAVNMASRLPAASYDVVVASDLLHHLPQEQLWRSFLDGVRHVLAPGGSLVVRDLHPTWVLRMLMAMSRQSLLFMGPLKARLQSFIDEQDLVAHYLAHWPRRYRDLLAEHGLNVEREANWLMHRITVARRPGGQA